MRARRGESWKVSVTSKGFNAKIKVGNAIRRGWFWFSRKKSALLSVSLASDAGVEGSLVRVKVAVSKCFDPSTFTFRWPASLSFCAELRFNKNSVLRFKAPFESAKPRPKFITASFRKCKAVFLKSTTISSSFTPKKTTCKYSVSPGAGSFETQISSVMGNMSLLCYFASQKEIEAAIFQAVGIVLTLISLLKLVSFRFIPYQPVIATSGVCLFGFVLSLVCYTNNFFHYAWMIWMNAISIGGIYVFLKAISLHQGATLFGNLAAVVVMGIFKWVDWEETSIFQLKFAENSLGWTGTIPFLCYAIAQWNSRINNHGVFPVVQLITSILTLIGIGKLIILTTSLNDSKWFNGPSWESVMQGCNTFASTYISKALVRFLFGA